MKRLGFILPLGLLFINGCDALTAHTAVAARAGSQELTTERLAALIGNSTVPLDTNETNNQQIAFAVADVWVNYQLLGQAAARHDTLKDTVKMNRALAQQFNNAKASKFRSEVFASMRPTDTVATEAEYTQGTLLSAAHILFMFPPGAGPPQMDSVKREAERVHRTVTTANFADMVKRHSKDPGSVDNKGLYTAFPRGFMVKEFEDGLLALQPGEISAPVQTMHGYHIIRRPLFSEVQAEHSMEKVRQAAASADSVFITNAQKSYNIQVKSNAPEMVRKIAEDVDANRNSGTVIATYRGGKYTGSDFARLVRSVPQRGALLQQLRTMPDTVLSEQIKMVVYQEGVLPLMADSAKVAPDSNEVAMIRSSLTNLLTDSWRQLGVEPATLGDSAANEAARMKEAATRIDQYVEGLMSSTRQYIPVPEPLETLLRSTYSSDIRTSGLKRALQQAVKVRATADSARAAQMRDAPGSSVPMTPPPGADSGGAPPATPPAGGDGRGGRGG